VTRTARTGTMRAWDSSLRTTYYRAMSQYVPSPIRAEITCLLSEEYSDEKEYDAAPWARLASSVRRGRLLGQHNTCVSTHLDVLAERLNEEFAEQPGRPAVLMK